VYALIAGPIEKHRKLPGNIGNGAIRDAAVNIKKNIIRIGAPLIFYPTLKGLACLFVTD
jgi:hypothetical protein